MRAEGRVSRELPLTSGKWNVFCESFNQLEQRLQLGKVLAFMSLICHILRDDPQ